MHDHDDRNPIGARLPLGPGAVELSDLLDSLTSLRLQIANATEAERALTATVGRTKLLEVQATLERAIGELRRALEATERRHGLAPGRGDGEQRREVLE